MLKNGIQAMSFAAFIPHFLTFPIFWNSVINFPSKQPSFEFNPIPQSSLNETELHAPW